VAQQYPPPPPPPPAGGPVQQNGLALGGMICGIVGIPLGFLFIPIIGIVLGIVAIALGVAGRSRATTTGIGMGQANAAIYTGAGAIVASIIAIVIVNSLIT
jgi:hypothetical protein